MEHEMEMIKMSACLTKLTSLLGVPVVLSSCSRRVFVLQLHYSSELRHHESIKLSCKKLLPCMQVQYFRRWVWSGLYGFWASAHLRFKYVEIPQLTVPYVNAPMNKQWLQLK